MSLWRIAWSYLWNRKLTTILTIVSVALGVALITAVLTLRDETRRRFEEEGQTFDMVVGAKGSALQLVLCAVYFMDRPPGNISTDIYHQIAEDPMVRAAFPIAIGDSFQGFPIVGTTPEYLAHERLNVRDDTFSRVLAFAEGEPFDEPMEIVIGAHVARATGVEVGDQVVGTHGFIELSESTREAVGFHSHEHQPYTVVGILEPSNSPNDRALFTNIQSVWDVHADPSKFPEWHGTEEEEAHQDAHDHGHAGHAHDTHTHSAGDEVTAVLVQLDSPADRFVFKDMVNRKYNAAADIPIQVIEKLYDQLLSTAKLVLLAVGYLVVVVSALSILIGLYLSIMQRRRDMAIMRALGASAYEIFGAVLIEAFWVTLLGIGLGWILGGAVTFGLSAYLAAKFGMTLNAFIIGRETVNAFAVILGVGILAGLLPAWQAYRSDVARDLAEL
ncbi:MAG: ABC transporter permease [Candidatus Hydrogenedentota bacterium]